MSAIRGRRNVISFCARPAIGVPCSRSGMALLSLPRSGWWQSNEVILTCQPVSCLNAPAQCDSPIRFGNIKFPAFGMPADLVSRGRLRGGQMVRAASCQACWTAKVSKR